MTFTKSARINRVGYCKRYENIKGLIRSCISFNKGTQNNGYKANDLKKQTLDNKAICINLKISQDEPQKKQVFRKNSQFPNPLFCGVRVIQRFLCSA
jgi:hypothetical protein